jgi:folate-binding protein YgfZ
MTADEFKAWRTGGLWRLEGRVVLAFTGPDRLRYVNGQVTNDVARLVPGRAMHAAVCNAKGKMQADLYVHALADALVADGPAELADTLPGRMERYLIADDAAMDDRTDRVHCVHVWGTRREDPLPGEWFRSENPWRLGCADGVDVVCREPVSDAGCGDAVAEVMRVLAGVPRWGCELDEDTLPPEVAEDRWISYTKGCYIGQETVSRLKSVGRTTRLMVGLETDDGSVPAAGAEVSVDGVSVGSVTSAVMNPLSGRGVALGFVRRVHAAPGTRVNVGGVAGGVVALPLG